MVAQIGSASSKGLMHEAGWLLSFFYEEAASQVLVSGENSL
jgi:hypothetical protein